ncbi:MAG: electron transfer flavoprotein subunit alpha, partial [Duncaniella sp.]|nr:electron transfer flavoprotein subunit alpha [Duncaniella sp.]
MDQNNLIVYLEFEDGRVADVSLELLTKGRVLASRLGVKLEAIVIGDNLTDVEKQVFPYGVDRLYKVSDKRLYPYTSNPHSAVRINLIRDIKPPACLMRATCIG